MHEIIEIINNSQSQPIERDENKYHTEIIATSCIWRENLEVEYTLQQKPTIGETYFVTLNQPVRFFLNMELWLFYDCPLAYYNGYEKEEEIELANFCLGHITKIVSYNNLGATIEFKISKMQSYKELLKNREIVELPKFWSDFFINYIDANDFQFETIGKYYVLCAFSYGDFGQYCIVTEYENDYFICMLDEWKSSEKGIFGGKFKLPDELKNRLIKA